MVKFGDIPDVQKPKDFFFEGNDELCVYFVCLSVLIKSEILKISVVDFGVVKEFVFGLGVKRRSMVRIVGFRVLEGKNELINYKAH